MKIDRALSCLESGWAVFPLIPNSKVPLTPHGFKDASKDPEVIKQYWKANPEANIGIATGMVSGIAVIDVDVKNGAKGYESLSLIHDLDATLSASTPTGGLHIYCILQEPLPGKNGYLPGIDLKSDGGYVVGPGSVIDGKEYEWVDPESHLACVPASVIKRMAEKQAAPPLASQPGDDTITEGSRNAVLASIAGTMRRRGLKADEIAAALKTVNTNRCSPPLPEPEVNAIAQSVSRYTPKAPASATAEEDDRPEGFSDDALALAFSDKHAADWRYVAAWSHWLNWDGTCWRKEDTLKAFDLARDICREASMQCEKPTAAAKAASANTVAAVEKLAKADRRHAAKIDIWDRDPWLLNAKNGVVDLKTGELRTHNRLDYLTKATTAGLAPAGTAPTRWLEFLNEITDGNVELQAYLARLAGYSLTGITSEHAFAFFYGTGANGKSVFLNTLGLVLGDYATNAPIDTFLETRSERHPTDLAGLRGARLVTAIEVEKGRRFADSKLKSITGGDKVTARFMRQDFFEYKPQFKLIIAGNDRPALKDVDEAMKRRLHLVPFTVTIPPEKRDHNLSEKLTKEADAILRWAVEGCLAWQKEGLNPPACVLDATDEYLESQDTLGRWLDEECEQDINASAPTEELFQSWKVWSERMSEYTGSIKKFSEDLQKRKFKPSRTSKARVFLGLQLKPKQVQDDFCERSHFSNEE